MAGLGVAPAAEPAHPSGSEFFNGVIHNLQRPEGRRPNAGLAQDASGALYGTAALGGKYNAGGTAYRLDPPAAGQQAWTYVKLHDFGQTGDGNLPDSAPVLDDRGDVYGTTAYGGDFGQIQFTGGTVYRLTRISSKSYVSTVLHSFGSGADGAVPQARVLRVAGGRLLGTTTGGGKFGQGIVYELTPPKPGATAWTETVLYDFAGGSGDGAIPVAGLYQDARGDLFGTTAAGGLGPSPGNGTVFELTPPRHPGGAWTETVLHFFAGGGDGAQPFSQLIADANGTLYGTTSLGGVDNYGTVWSLARSGSGWAETVLASFDGVNGAFCYSGLVADPGGDLFGTANAGGSGNGGTVFALLRADAAGRRSLRAIHDFRGLNGAFPYATPIYDPSGALYGTTYAGGTSDFGVIFAVTQK